MRGRFLPAAMQHVVKGACVVVAALWRVNYDYVGHGQEAQHGTLQQ